MIDDDEIFVQLMVDLLTSGEGYDVVSSGECGDEFAFVRDVDADLVILDVMTGREETGWSILDRLRGDPATTHLPVIVCSAASAALQHNASRLTGQPGIATVAKPFDVDELLAAITRLLA